MKHKQKLFLLLASALLFFATILICEVALQGAARIWHKADILTRGECRDGFIRDAQGSISNGDPSCFDHDSRGYRNRIALDQADIVTLGDSFTYGTNILDTAWPRIISTRLKTQVYNMALPATGPLLMLQHLPEALKLHPQVVIFGFYFGNDLFDDFEFAETHGMMSNFLPQSMIAEITKAEKTQNLVTKVDVLFPGGLQGKPSNFSRLKGFLANNSRLYGFLRSVKNNLFPAAIKASITRILEPRYEDAVAGILESERPYIAPFAENGWKTILAAPYRLGAIDLSDIRIQGGLEIVKQTLVKMNQICVGSNTRFIVALFPTKEFVFRAKVRDVSRYKAYESVVENEGIIRQQLLSLLKERNIDFVDPLKLLQNAVNQPYFENADGHPNVVGHEIIATAVEEHLKALGFRAAHALIN